jgi:Cu/Ag efflux protein CusF
VISLAGCGGPTTPPNQAAVRTPSPSPTATKSKDGTYTGRGKVTKLNHEIGSVEMDHEEIPDLMPAMRMEFYVTDKASIRGLAIGDTVTFTLLYDKGTEKITSIQKEK